MSNPFQARPSSFAKRPPARAARSKNRLFWGFGVSTAVVTVLILGWLVGQWGLLPGPLRNLLTLPVSTNQIFMAKGDLSLEQARRLYRQALEDLKNSNYQQALDSFKRLEGVYPGLEALLWLHEAEAYAGQANEWAVQKKLNSVISQHPSSPLKTVARYRLGQSQFRGSEWEKSLKTFQQVSLDNSRSTFATGSLYYQGAALAKNDATRIQAAEPLTSYLRQCPDCKFSGETADLLEKILPQPTPEEHGLMGLAGAASGKELKKTLAHLSKGPSTLTWLALGKTQIRAGLKPQGVQTLMSGLSQAKNMDIARLAVDSILSASTGPDKISRLNQLVQKHLPLGGDYALWKLSEINPSQASGYYQRILSDYPQSDYAPESGWRVLWPLLSNGQNESFIQQARQYVAKYPYGRSASKALFWTAKRLESSSPGKATRLYQQVLSHYPTSYYAFRSQGRLTALTAGKADPGWQTRIGRSYPPGQSDLNALDIMPPATAFSGGQPLRDAAVELQAIGASDDVRLLVEEATGSVPPAVESWAVQTAGDKAKGLRIIRDALDARAKESFQTATPGNAPKAAATPDELKLLYPVYFGTSIASASRQHGLDPFLVQSLMREESYFNEFAISGSNARGLMQLMPATAAEVAGWEKLPGFRVGDLFLPSTNIRLGCRYLGHLHQIFKGNSMPAVGAYNGGPGAMGRWVQSSPYIQNDPDMFVERIPYKQSRDYIKKVFASYWNYSRLYR